VRAVGSTAETRLGLRVRPKPLWHINNDVVDCLFEEKSSLHAGACVAEDPVADKHSVTDQNTVTDEHSVTD
jgi:hypothetical protein